MKRTWFSFFLIVCLLAACQPRTAQPKTQLPTADAPTAQATALPATPTVAAPTALPTPGKTLTVQNTQDAGEGSLRALVENAQPGEIITFDPAVFPPESPATIFLQSTLMLNTDRITIDASQAGVILDGSEISGNEYSIGLAINASYSTIRGLQIQNFSGPGLMIDPLAQGNLIGGDRSVGAGPFGQGNSILFTGVGIDLMGSNNTIQGNLIGTDASGTEKWGNAHSGIIVKDTASHNVIGPENIIAHNGPESINGGVEFGGGDTRDNRVTRNQIFDNSSLNITYNLQEGKPLIPLAPPVIIEADIAGGRAAGVACPGCVVEIFSTNAEKIQVYEGETLADTAGQFLFEKAGGFTGTIIEATAYLAGQNTSEFSLPYTETAGRLVLQNGNESPKQVVPNPVYEDLGQNRLGAMHYVNCDNPDLAGDYAHNATLVGEKFLRVNTEWYDWPEVEMSGEFSDYEISPCTDLAIDLIHENGVEMLYTLTYWDPEIQLTPGYSRFKDDAEIERFLEYTRFIVSRYKGKITRYSLLNEPNLTDGQRAVKAADYIRLAQQVIPVIREIEPQAKIVIGEVTPLIEPGSLEYLLTIARSDLMPQVDGLAWHGFSGNTPQYEAQFFAQYPGMVEKIVTTARENGFEGDFYSTELQYRTADTNRQLSETQKKYVYSHPVAVKYYARGITYHRGQGFWVTAGHEDSERVVGLTQMLTRLSGLLSNAEAIQTPVSFTPANKAYTSASFALPDDQFLVAVWNNAAAAEQDPGQPVDLALPGFQAEAVLAVDPVYGYQQALEYETTADGVVIRNFVLKDYPIYIHITGVKK